LIRFIFSNSQQPVQLYCLNPNTSLPQKSFKIDPGGTPPYFLLSRLLPGFPFPEKKRLERIALLGYLLQYAEGSTIEQFSSQKTTFLTGPFFRKEVKWIGQSLFISGQLIA